MNIYACFQSPHNEKQTSLDFLGLSVFALSRHAPAVAAGLQTSNALLAPLPPTISAGLKPATATTPDGRFLARGVLIHTIILRKPLRIKYLQYTARAATRGAVRSTKGVSDGKRDRRNAGQSRQPKIPTDGMIDGRSPSSGERTNRRRSADRLHERTTQYYCTTATNCCLVTLYCRSGRKNYTFQRSNADVACVIQTHNNAHL